MPMPPRKTLPPPPRKPPPVKPPPIDPPRVIPPPPRKPPPMDPPPPIPPRLIPPPPRIPPPMDPPPPRRCATPTPTARLQHKAIRNTSLIWSVPLLGSLLPLRRHCNRVSVLSWKSLPRNVRKNRLAGGSACPTITQTPATNVGQTLSSVNTAIPGT